MDAQFDRQKQTSLSAVDLSRKGSVDAPIEELIQFINSQRNYFTTSSCSGRIIVVDNEADGTIKKKGCKWILTSHEEVDGLAVLVCLKDIEDSAVFKFEPFVLHVQCRSLSDAQLLLSCGVASGFRNSGISMGNKGKFITAIRSTNSLEVPLSHDGKLLVSSEYVSYIVDLAKKKMRENIERINRFYINIQESLTENKASGECIKTQRKVTSSTKKKKAVPTEQKSKPSDKGRIEENNLEDSTVEDLNLDGCCLFDYEDVT